MNLKLEDKTALITGSTAGIGFATALALAREGARVIVNGRSQERVDAALAKIHREVPRAKAEGVALDLGAAAGCEALVRKFPSVDILVNNLGIFEPKPFEQIPDADWLRLFEVNVMSGVRLSRAYLPGMKQRNWGRIVFISSESAVQIPAEMVHYGMTKTAQVAVARGIAETCAGSAVSRRSARRAAVRARSRAAAGRFPPGVAQPSKRRDFDSSAAMAASSRASSRSLIF